MLNAQFNIEAHECAEVDLLKHVRALSSSVFEIVLAHAVLDSALSFSVWVGTKSINVFSIRILGPLLDRAAIPRQI